MKLPLWVIGENLEEAEPVDSYVVRLAEPRIVAKATQKRGVKLMLTVRGPEPAEASEDWHRLLKQGAHFWATQVGDAEYARRPPEILVNDELELPRFLLCDDANLKRVFIVHPGPPAFFVAEIRGTIPDLPAQHPRLRNAQGQWLVIDGQFPDGAGPILKQVAALLGW